MQTMNTKLRSLLLAIFLAAAGVASVSAQTTPASDPLAALPASDAVMFADLRRILIEVVPRVLAKDPATLAKMLAALDDVKQKSGLDILTIERIALGVQFLGPVIPTVKKEDVGVVIIVRGDFNESAMVAFLKSESKGKLGEESYGGKVIYREPPPAPPKKRTERATFSVSLFDPHTLVLGDLLQVRATIDAAASGNGRVDPALVELAKRDSSALIGAAGNVPESFKQQLSASAPPDEIAQAINRAFSGIRQTFGSVSATPTDFNLIVGARLASAEQAQSVADMLLGVRQQAGPFIPDQKIRAMLDSLQVSAQNDEVQISCSVKTEVVQNFIASMKMKPKLSADAPAPAAEKAAPAKTRRTMKSRRSRRRKGP